MVLSRIQIHQLIKEWLKSVNKPLLVVEGPTASGKTKLAVDLAKAFDGEVINADSRQIYQDIRIGNALTSSEDMQGIPHHLFSFFPLSDSVTVVDYKKLCKKTIEEVHSRGKLPVLCGGTTMWIDAVVDNYVVPLAKANPELREELEKLSIDELLSRLNVVDPDSAERLVKERNKRYIIRALEVYELTGKTKTATAKKGKRQYDVFKVAPHWEREELYRRIDQRTQEQFDAGLVGEVQDLVEKYAGGDLERFVSLNWPGLTSIGCKEVLPYLQGQVDLNGLISRVQQANRNYAKRQLTWLRKDKEVNWIEGK